jgi:hypothetical protein
MFPTLMPPLPPRLPFLFPSLSSQLTLLSKLSPPTLQPSLFLQSPLLLSLLPLSHSLIASFMFPTNLPTHSVPAGTLSKLTFLNPVATLLHVLVLLTAAITVTSSANTPMMHPFLIPQAIGGSFGIDSLLHLMASLSSVIVFSLTLPLPLEVLVN